MIDATEIIEKQLHMDKAEDVVFSDESTTRLTPARYVPVLAGENSRVSLNGTWKVTRWPFEKDEEILSDLGLDDSKWEEVQQPGKVFYGDAEEDPRKIKGWDRVTLAHIDENDGAVMRRLVFVPKEWGSKRIHLRFDAIYPAGRVYCNGVLLGEHTSGLTPCEWDITGIARPGEENIIAVRLLCKHKHVQLDMPRHALEFAGLAQDAYLHSTEQCRISDFHLITAVDEALEKGTIEGSVQIENGSEEERSCKLTITLTGPDKEKVSEMVIEETLPAGGKKDVDAAIEAGGVSLWNDEHPILYSVSIRLEVGGQESQDVLYQTGFRRFTVANERAILNGRPVKFRGVNQLTYHPDHGMYTPKEWLRKSLTLMKRANVNTIRTHFLGPPALSELCDEMGIYLLQELPVDWGTNFIHDPEWIGPSLMRIEGGIRRDRHHPSVMVWSIGNENMPTEREDTEAGWNHLRIFEKFAKTIDPSRPTMFPPPGPANKIKGIFEVRVGDIADIHYSFKLIEDYHKTGKITNPKNWKADMETTTKEEAMANGWSGVWFSSEYGAFNYQPDLLNAPYLSVITDVKEDILSGKNTQQVFIDRLRREWGLMRSDQACLGGAYFPWLCSGTGNNPWGWVRWGEDADWGVITADLLPKPAFWALRVLFSPVQFPERIEWIEGQTKLEFEVNNGFNSIDLSECTLRTMIGNGGNWMGQMGSWKDVPVSCPPGEKTVIEIAMHKGALDSLKDGLPIACRCILLDPVGFRVVMADIVVAPPKIDNGETSMPVGPDAEL